VKGEGRGGGRASLERILTGLIGGGILLAVKLSGLYAVW